MPVAAGVVAGWVVVCVMTVPQPCRNNKMKTATGKNGGLKFIRMLPTTAPRLPAALWPGKNEDGNHGAKDCRPRIQADPHPLEMLGR